MNDPLFFSRFVSMVREMFSPDEFIPLHAPQFKGREKELVMQTLESPFVSSVGEFVDEFGKQGG